MSTLIKSAALGLALALSGPLAAPAFAQAIAVAGLGPVDIETYDVRVVSVDAANRNIVVGKDGKQWRITVPEIFGDISGLKPRDEMTISRVSGALVAVTPPQKGAKPDIDVAATETDGTFQNLPAKWVTRKVTVTAKFLGFDAKKNTVTFEGPEGTRTVPVTSPDVIDAVKKLKKNDMVALVFAEATQVVIKPRKF